MGRRIRKNPFFKQRRSFSGEEKRKKGLLRKKRRNFCWPAKGAVNQSVVLK